MRKALADLQALLSNDYYKLVVKPELAKDNLINTLVNNDVVDLRTFFLREQTIGELRAFIRLEEMLEGQLSDLQEEVAELDEEENNKPTTT